MNPYPFSPARGLYLLTPDEHDTQRLLTQIDALLASGVAMLQLRNKRAGRELRRAQAVALLALCRRHDVPLIINDDWRLAAEIGAAGAHLGEGDGELAQARAALGPEAILGASCYGDLRRGEHAQAAGASYLAFGAFFDSTTKPLARCADLSLLRRARQLGLPTVAIGGITPDNASSVIAAGADFVAVIGAVFNAPDPPGAARALRACFP